MTKRYDVKTPRPKKDGSVFWHRIGTAFERDNGGISVILDSLPLPDKDGRVVMNLWEPMERDRPAAGGGDVEGEIPFGPEVR